MRRTRKECSLSRRTLLAEALALSCLVQSRGGTQAFALSPCSPARGYHCVRRPTSGTAWQSSDFGKGLPRGLRRNYRLKATAATPRGARSWCMASYEEKTLLLPRRRRWERESRRSLSQQRWHRRYCTASSLEEDITVNETDGGETDRQEVDLETASQDEFQEEKKEESGGEFSELSEELEDVRAAFLDGPGQYLDVEKILTETEHIDHANVPEGFRTGYVTIVGSPNVGKSTLMNSMIGDRLSIVTPKAGTTRHRITGIMTGNDFQIIYQDTPGVLTPAYMLHEGMMNFVQEAMGDADAVLFVTDLFEVDFSSPQIFERMLASGKPIVVAVNKVDLLPSDGDKGDGEARPGRLSAVRLKEVGSLEDILQRWRERLPGATVLPISALEGINTVQLAEELKQHIPEGPPLYATNVMSDKPLRFFASEIIREQIFVSFSQEIPYSCEVRLDKFKERQAETLIAATIVVAQESQKGMVIGKGGAKIKEVGIKARNALEEYLDVRVNLRLNVKVDKNWRKKKQSLKEYGYIS